jgi:uncharacterized protein (TIGR00375 family)
MKFVADLHLHSKYSRAVSQNMTLPNMAHWAKMKGISVLATGDFTHPFWFERLKSELVPEGNGLYKLKEEILPTKSEGFIDVKREPVHFLLSCEISSIYSQGGQTRRVHNLFFFPGLESVEKFNNELLRRGTNLRADGRPIVGISSRDLAEIALSCDESSLIVPAHAWTPWFSVFGSFSGFDSIEECFGDLSQKIYAIETGLSSDPAMNWRIGELDKRAVLSFSDAHSLEKMGREATVFEADDVSYQSIYDAVAGRPGAKIAFTIEFYPEEGKYHYTGHRDCNFSQSPEESRKNGDVCPVCHRPLTVGVMHRVEELATREESLELRELDDAKWIFDPSGRRPYYVSLVPLGEILAEVFGVGVGTKKVVESYITLINSLGSEFSVLLKANLSEISKLSSERVAEAIGKVRNRNIVVEPGYDGKFGVVKIWHELQGESVQVEDSQLNLFA